VQQPRQVFPSGMIRDESESKTMWHLVIDGPMLTRWAERMTMGAKKYGHKNWMKADGEEERSRFKESAFRHFMQWYNDETDEDHAAAVFFNINGTEYVNERLTAEPTREVGEDAGTDGDRAGVNSNEGEEEEYPVANLGARSCVVCATGGLHILEERTNREDGYHPRAYDPDPDLYGRRWNETSLD